MFKVVENQNGTTTIYDKKTGKFMCDIPTTSKKSPRASKHNDYKKHRKSPKITLPCSPKRKLSYDSGPKVKEEPFKPRSPLPPEDDPIDLECLDENTFFSFLNLAKPKLIAKCKNNFNDKVPLTKLESVVPNHNSHPGISSYNEKFIDFSSQLGQRIIARNQKNHSKLPLAHQPYEKYCSIPSPLNSSLRKRDTLNEYPSTYRAVRSNKGFTHSYPTSPKDKREKYVTLNTGLNMEGRILKKKCKSLQVKIKPLSIRELLNHNVKDYKLLEEISKPKLHRELWQREIMSNVDKYILKPNVIVDPLEYNIIKKNGHYEVEGCKLREDDVRLLENNNISFSTNSQKRSKNVNILNLQHVEPIKLRPYTPKVILNSSPLKEHKSETICNGKQELQRNVNKPIITHIKKCETPCILPNNDGVRINNAAKPVSPKYGDIPKTSNSYFSNTNGVDNMDFSKNLYIPKPWKLLIPNTIESSKWNFNCYKCNISNNFVDKEEATEHITVHMNKNHPLDPKSILQLCCLKYADHNEVTIQAFSS